MQEDRRCFCDSLAAIFGRGREADQGSAVCQFCDTDFVGTDGPGGGKFEQPADLAQAAAAQWPAESSGGDRCSCVPEENQGSSLIRRW